MKHKHTKALSVLLTVCMIVGLLPWTMLSARADGSCGDGVTWTLENGVLTISKTGEGTGAMTDYQARNAPWYGSRNSITSVVIESGVTSICTYAFYQCENFTSITIPAGVTTIGNGAFYYCKKLATVTIPASVTTIGEIAFSDCEALTSVTFVSGSQLTSIGRNAFYHCGVLASIDIPSSVTTIGNAAFQGTAFTTVTIPSGVTSIGMDTFSRSGLTSVSIPANVTTISSGAFNSCANLATVTFASNSQLTSIGSSAFSSCTSLTSITIPASVTSIGNNAFFNSGLTSITIPANVTSIGNGAFSNCTSLTEIAVADGNTSFCADGGVLFDADKRTLKCYPAGKTGDSYVIPDTVTSIDSSAFRGCTNLTSVTIPPDVNYNNVHFPDGVTKTQISGGPVARVDSTEYDGIQAAIDAATSGATITLLRNVLLNAPLTIDSGKTVTLDLAGFTVDRGISDFRTNGNVITISGGNLTLTDSSTGKTGKITGGWNKDDKGGGVYVSSGTFTMNGGTICNNFVAQAANDYDHSDGYGGGVYIASGGAFTMSGGKITQNWGLDNGGVYVLGGTFTMSGGEIIGNVSYNPAYGGVCDYGTFSVSGSPIIKNNIVNASYSYITYSSNIYNNTAVKNVYLGSSGQITITDALTDGASIGVSKTTTGVFTSGGSFTDNAAARAVFSSDNNGYVVVAENNEAKLVSAVTVTFDANGGSGTMADVHTAKDGDYTLPACGFTTPTGKLFDKWSVKIGDAEAVTKAAGDTISATANVTVTATWVNNPASSSSDSSDDYAPSNTETTTNADGSTTRTTTNADGSKTAVTTKQDGSTVTVNTAKDGSAVTTEKTADGSTATVKTDKSGSVVSTETAPSTKAIENAEKSGEPVTLPVEVKATGDAASAPEVQITLPKGETGVRVEIPVENLTSGTVAVIVKPDGTEEIVKTSVTGKNGVVLTLEESATVKLVDNTKTFSDVQPNDWFAPYVAWAASRGIMNGMGDGTFAPNATASRAQIAQMLFNLDGAQANGDLAAFGDVHAGDWFADAVTWLVENGIAQGTGASFGADSPISREQLAVMLYNYAQFKGYDVSVSGDVSGFPDADKVDGYARSALAWAVGVGLISGSTDEHGNVVLDPQGSATRGQIAAIIERFCENVAK